MDRHLTVSGFVVYEDRVALHWHRKIGMWLPAGGHLEAGETPVEAVLRETREEFAIEAEVISTARRVGYEGGPAQIEPPFTILVCQPEPGHEHIDMVYFLRALSGYPGRCYDPHSPIVWFDAASLRLGSAETGHGRVAFAPDVQALALEAIATAGSAPLALSIHQGQAR